VTENKVQHEKDHFDGNHRYVAEEEEEESEPEGV